MTIINGLQNTRLNKLTTCDCPTLEQEQYGNWNDKALNPLQEPLINILSLNTPQQNAQIHTLLHPGNQPHNLTQNWYGDLGIYAEAYLNPNNTPTFADCITEYNSETIDDTSDIILNHNLQSGDIQYHKPRIHRDQGPLLQTIINHLQNFTPFKNIFTTEELRNHIEDTWKISMRLELLNTQCDGGGGE